MEALPSEGINADFSFFPPSPRLFLRCWVLNPGPQALLLILQSKLAFMSMGVTAPHTQHRSTSPCCNAVRGLSQEAKQIGMSDLGLLASKTES
jgi:hypothetical protein